MNKNAPEAIAAFELIDNKIQLNRTRLESESTPADELPQHRAKLAALTTLKKELEEKYSAGTRQ